MILTCPRCATRYLVDELQVWATGRTVECEACGMRWRAVGRGVRPVRPTAPAPVANGVDAATLPAVERVADPAPPSPEIQGEASPEVAEAVARPAGPPDDDGGPLFVPRRPDDPARRSRARDKAQGGGRIPPAVLAGWGVTLLVLVVLVVAIARREELAGDMPALAAVYSAVGLPVAVAPVATLQPEKPH